MNDDIIKLIRKKFKRVFTLIYIGLILILLGISIGLFYIGLVVTQGGFLKIFNLFLACDFAIGNIVFLSPNMYKKFLKDMEYECVKEKIIEIIEE